jgi:hypothetical protein
MKVRSVTACALAVVFLAVSSTVAVAQGRGQDRGQGNNQGQGSNGQDNGQHNGQWDRDHHNTFNDQDRQITRDWYQQHQRNLGRGWRQRDRLSPAMQSRLRPGQRLDPQLRRQMQWLPADLSRQYAPAPVGYRYAIIGGNVVMLDGGYGVHDVFSLTLHF